MAPAGPANDASTILDWNQAFSFALCTDLTCFCIDRGSPMIAMVFRVELNQTLAFLETVGLTEGA